MSPERPIIVVGPPTFVSGIKRLAANHSISIIAYKTRRRYVARLANDQPRLILVDASLSERDFWITTPRVSPATHRIPLIVIAAGMDDEPARLAGATDVWPIADLDERFTAWMGSHHAGDTVNDPLDDPCAQPLPPRAVEAIEKFNAGEYYKQHDLLEAQWMEDTRPVRVLYQAILQVGIAYFQVTRKNRRGAHKMLLRARQWLAMLPDTCQGVDVARLRRDAFNVQAALEHLTDDQMDQFDTSLLKSVKLK